ncbi:MAG: type sorting protein [Bacteroidetes bacterium]|nr:type sorting protein [Bacteroidota bacterium]
MKQTFILLTLIALSISSFAQKKIKVLFIGNSYTSVNDLPHTVAQVASGLGDTVIYDSNAPGGYTFQQHSVDATTLSKIAQGTWDFVVLQEQSQRPSFDPSQVEVEVYPYAHTLDSLIHAANPCTETVFYMTWGKKNGDSSNCGVYPPVCTYSGSQDRLSQSYTEMGQLNSATVAPAGEAWRNIINQNVAFDLYNPDQSHPSIYGTYLTAHVFCEVLFRKHYLIGTYVTPGISTTDAGTLRTAAYTVVSDSLSKWLSPGNIPVAAFTSHVTDSTVAFTSTSINGNSFSWSFGDGTSGSGATTSHTYHSSGNYLVTLRATDHCKTDSIRIYVSVLGGSNGIDNMDSHAPKIYPNPANTELHIDLGDTDIKNAAITLVNNLGQTVRKVSPASSIVSINVADLPVGIYSLVIAGRTYPVSISR